MAQQKTYWHLLSQKRMPNEYEIVTSKLLCYTGEGLTGKRFELDVPLQEWYRQYQQGSSLSCSSWEKFRDPRETTYTKYAELQREKEVFVDGILDEIEVTGYDKEISPTWLPALSRLVAPLRYPVHGFQMLAAYVGHTAPSGRIAITGALQAGDEMRRVQRIAYRIRQLQLAFPGFGEDSKTIWQDDPVWQPLREGIEKLLIAYDWGESFAGLNLVVKPMVDRLFMKHLSDLALQQGDYLLGQIFYSLDEDCQWHRQWSQALVRMAIEDNAQNVAVLQGWVNKWYSLAARAMEALTTVWEKHLKERSREGVLQQVVQDYGEYLDSMNLRIPA
jgi:toluene monooxygenase system protein E